MLGSRPALGLGLLVSATVLAGCASPHPRAPCSTEGPVATLCGFHNPEDLEHVPSSGLIVVSNMRFDGPHEGGGYLSAFTPGHDAVRTLWPLGTPGDVRPEPGLGDAGCDGPPNRGAFYPHGLTSMAHAGAAFLYVVAHEGEFGGREAVEIFELRGRGAKAVLSWKACILTENAIRANDVAISPDGEVFVSNYEPSLSIVHTLRASVLHSATGDVMAWRRGQGWRHVEGTTAAMPNGVAVSDDGRMIFYTETGTGLAYRTPRDTSPPSIDVNIGGHPDNITHTPRGTLLIATHTGGSAFLACRFGRLPCRTSWEVHELDPHTMAVRRIFAHDGQAIGAVATALEVGETVYVSSVFDDRIGMIPKQG